MSLKSGQTIALGAALVGLDATSLLVPSFGEGLRWTAERMGAARLGWIGLLLTALALVLAGCAAIALAARMRAARLQCDEALAEARSVSFFTGEALEGMLALADMSRRVVIERQALQAQARGLVLAAIVIATITVVGCGFGRPALLAEIAAALAASATAAILLIFARVIRETARALVPTEAEIRAALVRHQEREEAERRLLRPNLTALAGTVLT